MFEYAIFTKADGLRYWKLYLINNEVYITELKFSDCLKIALKNQSGLFSKIYQRLNQIDSLPQLKSTTVQVINISNCDKIEIKKGQLMSNKITISLCEKEYKFGIILRNQTESIITDLVTIFHNKLEVNTNNYQ